MMMIMITQLIALMITGVPGDRAIRHVEVDVNAALVVLPDLPMAAAHVVLLKTTNHAILNHVQ
jgi:hypothetical protein